ncbi:MAG TPA: RNA polymerase sigma-54 factor [Deltaproteobacteria bacterium]|nr:RNA polymerase sigma-54 factor [Deltaproteobacteria bacterium]
MAYEVRQELRLTQQLVMTPQLQLAIKLLLLPKIELETMVREEIQTNPVLEDTIEAEGREVKREEDTRTEIDWQSYLDDYHDTRMPGVDFSARDEDGYVENVSSAGSSLGDHLYWQLVMAGLPDEDFKLGEFIIGNIDENGYLRVVESADERTAAQYEQGGAELGGGCGADRPRGALLPFSGPGDPEWRAVEVIASHTGVAVSDVERVLAVIQDFDPPGAGARSVRECLLLQARSLPVRDTLVEEIICRHLDTLARKNLKAIARDLGVTAEEVAEAARTISRSLSPAPGSAFGSDDSRVIVPDVYVHKVDGRYVVTLNEDGMPKLKVSGYYKRLLKSGGAMNEEAKGYIQEKLRSAAWLIKSVQQRQRTIYRVVESIVRFQQEFLDKGLKYLKPLVLKDVAEDIDVHESTVSRVTSNKYVHTPRGIYELKFFFSSSLGGGGGDAVAVEYIKERLRKIIESEDPASPLSDKQLVEKLREAGIDVARRTVAKYRESMGFLSSTRRKKSF